MRALDWSTTPLGPVEQWPQALRTMRACRAWLRLSDGHLLGAALRAVVQRCLPADSRNKAPVGAGSRRPRGISRGMGFHRADVRVRDGSGSGPPTFCPICWSLLPATTTSKRSTSRFRVSPIPDDNGRVGGVLEHRCWRRRNGCSKIDAGIC